VEHVRFISAVNTIYVLHAKTDKTKYTFACAIIRPWRYGLPKIYTRHGDEGETSLLYGGRVSKTDLRCGAYGTVDEAVSALGLARSNVKTEKLRGIIEKVQRDLFTVGAELATSRDEYNKLEKNFNVVTQDMVDELEHLIDGLMQELTLPQAFIIPGASAASAAMDLGRSILRRAERQIVELRDMGLLGNQSVLKYINRLADLVFVMARYEDKDLPFETLTG